MDYLFRLNDRVISGAPDRIADVANLGQLVDQQLLLANVDLRETTIVRRDILGVAQHVGPSDHLSLPRSAAKVLPVDRIAANYNDDIWARNYGNSAFNRIH